MTPKTFTFTQEEAENLVTKHFPDETPTYAAPLQAYAGDLDPAWVVITSSNTVFLVDRVEISKYEAVRSVIHGKRTASTTDGAEERVIYGVRVKPASEVQSDPKTTYALLGRHVDSSAEMFYTSGRKEIVSESPKIFTSLRTARRVATALNICETIHGWHFIVVAAAVN